MPPWAPSYSTAADDPNGYPGAPDPNDPQPGGKRRAHSPPDAPAASKKSKRSRGKAKARPPQFHLKKDDIPPHLQGAKVRGTLLCSLSIFLTVTKEFNLPSWRYPLWHMLRRCRATTSYSCSFCCLRRTLCGRLSLQIERQPPS
jgi:hypothetical protein